MFDPEDDDAGALSVTEAELDALVAKALERGRREQREETARLMRAFCTLNGDGPKFLKAFEEFGGLGRKGQWREEDHKRDHGKFAKQEGGSDADSREGGTGGGDGDKPRGDIPGAAVGVPRHSAMAKVDPDERAAGLAKRISEVPAAVAARVREWVSAKYQKLSARYGAAGAKAILGAMVLLAPTPIPGSSLLPVAIAEAVLRIRRQVAALSKAMPDLSDEHIQALARDLLHELYEAEGESLDPPDDDAADADPDDTDLYDDSPAEQLAAAADYARECQREGVDPEEGLHALYERAHGGRSVGKAWREEDHPRADDGKFSHGAFTPEHVEHAGRAVEAKMAGLRDAPNVDLKQRQYLGQASDLLPPDAAVPDAVRKLHVFYHPDAENESGAAALFHLQRGADGKPLTAPVLLIGPGALEHRGSSGSLGDTVLHEVEHAIDFHNGRETSEFTPRFRQMMRELTADLASGKESAAAYVNRHVGQDNAEAFVRSWFNAHPGHDLTDEEVSEAAKRVVAAARTEIERKYGTVGKAWKAEEHPRGKAIAKAIQSDETVASLADEMLAEMGANP